MDVQLVGQHQAVLVTVCHVDDRTLQTSHTSGTVNIAFALQHWQSPTGSPQHSAGSLVWPSCSKACVSAPLCVQDNPHICTPCCCIITSAFAIALQAPLTS